MKDINFNDKIKGTQTEKNLWSAFSGECEARVRYEFFADMARKDGYEQIASIFDETSHNEREHAEIWYGYLGQVSNTENNLKRSSKLEEYESTEMYINFANIAKEEGLDDISKKFQQVAQIEKAHGDRYNKLRNNILEKEVFSKNTKVIWQCRNCGYLLFAENAPEHCPVCGYDQGFFQLQENNF